MWKASCFHQGTAPFPSRCFGALGWRRGEVVLTFQWGRELWNLHFFLAGWYTRKGGPALVLHLGWLLDASRLAEQHWVGAILVGHDCDPKCQPHPIHPLSEEWWTWQDCCVLWVMTYKMSNPCSEKEIHSVSLCRGTDMLLNGPMKCSCDTAKIC